MSYYRGGKVWVEQEMNGWVALEKDWSGGLLPQDLVSENSFLGVDFNLVDPISRAAMGGYCEWKGKWLFYLSSETISFHGMQEDSIFLVGDFNNWKLSETYKLIAIEEGQGVLLTKAFLKSFKECKFKFCSAKGRWIEPHQDFPGSNPGEDSIKNFIFSQNRTGKDLFRFRRIKSSPAREAKKWIETRPEGEFGFSFKKDRSCFRVFAPRAHRVDLLFFKNGQSSPNQVLPLSRSDDGSWSIIQSGNCSGELYKFRVTQKDSKNQLFSKDIVDPYAKAITNRDGPAVAISTHYPSGKKKFQPPAMEDAVVVEAHLRDLLSHAPYDLNPEQRLEFRGLSKWLSDDHCYLRKIGANVVELQPVHEFDTKSKQEYHWGYMPVNFFSPASVYGSCSSDGSVIKEFTEMVDSFHSCGIAVVLDVVYNHVGIPPHLIHLDREIYCMTDEAGELTNFSGCGNDLNCRSQPVKKIILDSLIYWVEQFDIDGFRFDLGELLGFELLAEIEYELKKIKPGILLFAEPWSFRGRLPTQMNQTGYALWSDSCREEMFVFAKNQGRKELILELLKSGLDQDNVRPCQSVNYVESHDDFSFVDRLLIEASRNETDALDDEVVSRVMIAMGLLLVAPGVPMISAGQDFLRHKNGIRNTYQEGEINALDYSLEERFQEESKFVRKLIDLRLGNPGRRARRPWSGEWEIDSFKTDLSRAVVFGWHSKRSQEKFLVLANPSNCKEKIDLPLFWNEGMKNLISYHGDEKCPEVINPLSFSWFASE